MNSNDSLSDALADLDALLAAGLAAFGKAATPEASRRRGSSTSVRSKAGSRPRRSGSSRSSRPRGGPTASGSTPSRPRSKPPRGRPSRASSGRSPAAAASTSPCPGIRPRLGHRHPLTQTADELIDLFGRFGFAVAPRPGGRGRPAQLRRPQHPAEPPGPRPARQLLPARGDRGAEGQCRASDAACRCSAARRAPCRSGSWRRSRRRSG